jgi:hypothetical protein
MGSASSPWLPSFAIHDFVNRVREQVGLHFESIVRQGMPPPRVAHAAAKFRVQEQRLERSEPFVGCRGQQVRFSRHADLLA